MAISKSIHVAANGIFSFFGRDWGQEEKGTTEAKMALQSCPTLCDPIDGSPPGSPVPGILQARTLEWVAVSLSVHESEK